MESVISKGLRQEFANVKAKYSDTSHWDRAILDCVTSCLRKRLVKEQITICTDSQTAVAALAACGTKSLLGADCREKLTVLSEVNQATIIWVPGHSGNSAE